MCRSSSAKQYTFILFLIFLSFNIVSCDATRDLEFVYHNYSSMTSFLKEFNKKNGDLSELYSIGKSIRKRELWVMKLTATDKDTPLIPNIKLLANIHGNEAAGREILLHFIPYLVNGYRRGNAKIAHILNNNIVHILPSLNPDGFEKSSEGRCSGSGRENDRDVDLNRNFPDVFHENTIPRQPETNAVIKWMNRTKFILSASLHGGTMVANYPFESIVELTFKDAEHKSPDDDVFKSLALVYSKTHPTMHLGKPCPGSNSEIFVDGITNGAAWYPLMGGMQDYNYAFHGCMELTLEVSCCKYPLAKELNSIWLENKNALTEYCLQAGMGVKGTIKDVDTLKPIVTAILVVMGRNITFYTSSKGEFYRILLPGIYDLKVKATNYKTIIVPFRVEEQEGMKMMTTFNVLMTPGNDTDIVLEDGSSTVPPDETITNFHDEISTHKVVPGKRFNDYDYNDYTSHALFLKNNFQHEFNGCSINHPKFYTNIILTLAVLLLNFYILRF